MQSIRFAQYTPDPDRCEDVFCCLPEANALCVADGCGGLGSRRYAGCGGMTGALISAQTVCAAFAQWAGSGCSGQGSAEKLRDWLYESLKAKAEAIVDSDLPRVRGTIQRTLPSVFCGAVTEDHRITFYHCGDCRGFFLDAGGLHQYTRDDVRGDPDALRALYTDSPLTAYCSADAPFPVHQTELRISDPGLLMLCTDGVYGAFPAPAETELLVLSALLEAKGDKGWMQKIRTRLSKCASDDATLLIVPVGVTEYAQLQQLFADRLRELKQRFISPARRHANAYSFLEQSWQAYRADYERMHDGAGD